MTTFNLNDADAATAQTIERWLSNVDEQLQFDARAACLTAVLEGSGSGTRENAAELYREALAGRGDLAGFSEVAGLYLADTVRAYLRLDYSQEPLSARAKDQLLGDLLDFGNRAVWAEIADSFMPDDDDLEALGL